MTKKRARAQSMAAREMLNENYRLRRAAGDKVPGARAGMFFFFFFR